MAQRLATEYVKASLTLSESEMIQFLQAAEDPLVQYHIKVLDNGAQEMVLRVVTGEVVVLPFDYREGIYVCELACRLFHPHLTHLMRRLFMRFKGDGIVNYVYSGFTMKYMYKEGVVRKIIEESTAGCKLVYEYKNTLEELQTQFNLRSVETEISALYQGINELLDARNKVVGIQQLNEIDQKLAQMSSRLLKLEG